MKTKKAATVFIFITVLIDVIGIGIVIPIIPALIQELVGGTISDASHYAMGLVLIYASMQFLFSPIIGGLSDQYGRRKVLLFSLLGFGIDSLFQALAPTIGWLFIGRTIAGITGASFTTANAYIADVSTPEKRAQNFGLLGAAFGLGFIIGPTLGGVLGSYDTRLPFYASAVLSLLNWLYGYFVLPESLAPENRRKFDIKRANPIGSLLNLKRYPFILSLVASLFLVYVAGHAVQSSWSFYTIEKFKWTEMQVGLSLGFVGLMIAIVQGGLIRVIIPKIGQVKSLFVGLTINMFGLLAFAFVTQGWMMYAIMVPFALSGLANPAFQGIISSQVKPNEQGELQGALTSVLSIAAIVGQPLMLGLFGYFSAKDSEIYFPGAPFLLGSFFCLISIIVTRKILASQKG
ncbi:TCR/Tet family MFS transporter [Arcticibacterium luteifluviistationis]|uniref:Tetracycline resistance MFS efflux pump n=1 Tax=Arcticibacterium luteifluviistationis TaxID=1784714 RepID=A0A2Z4GDX0_9BACT|nr:TCR/Tet family MFS transporter [Arcticibacterium luteifluviistationis]AWV99317.1 tetracycline resistance MFS efflux pump [Arcticibacterium luteifluviistationis]